MKNKKHLYLLIVVVLGTIIVAADSLILLFFRYPFSQLIPRVALPGLAFIAVYTVVMGRFAQCFAPDYFRDLDSDQLQLRYKKIGSIPLKLILLNIFVHLIFLLCLFLPKRHLQIDPTIKTALFWTTQSMGMLVGSFMYVVTDGLVSRTLMTHGLFNFPRNLRESRQSLKILLVPFIITVISLIFAISIMLLAIGHAGGTISKMQNSIIAIPVVFYTISIVFLSYVLRKNSKVLYTSVINQLENLSSEQKDLTKRISVCSVDELGTIAGMVNTFSEHMNQGIREIKEGQGELSRVGTHLEEDASGMAASIAQISGAAEQVRKKTQGQMESVTTSSETIQNISESIKALEESIATQASSMI